MNTSFGDRVFARRTSIGASWGSIEIPLSKMLSLPLWVIMSNIVSGFFMMGILNYTPLGNASAIYQLLFAALWLGASVYYLRQDKSGTKIYQKLFVLWQYLPGYRRKVVTRSDSNVGNFASVVGLREIEEDGTLHFIGGDAGVVFDVSGNASLLIFEQDKTMILKAVRDFWNNLPHGVTHTQITLREPQPIEQNLAHLKKTYDECRLKDDPSMLLLMEELRRVLQEDVGRRSMSLRQYVILRGKNWENLEKASVRMVDAARAGKVFTSVTRLDQRACRQLIRTLYGPSAEV